MRGRRNKKPGLVVKPSFWKHIQQTAQFLFGGGGAAGGRAAGGATSRGMAAGFTQSAPGADGGVIRSDSTRNFVARASVVTRSTLPTRAAFNPDISDMRRTAVSNGTSSNCNVMVD